MDTRVCQMGARGNVIAAHVFTLLSEHLQAQCANNRLPAQISTSLLMLLHLQRNILCVKCVLVAVVRGGVESKVLPASRRSNLGFSLLSERETKTGRESKSRLTRS